MSAENRLRALGIELPQLSAPVANYVNAVRAGKLLFLAGKGPSTVDGLRPQGKIGREFDVEQGYRFARSSLSRSPLYSPQSPWFLRPAGPRWC